MKQWVFLVIQGIIYSAFLWIDMFVPGGADISIYLKYAGIFLCFLYVFFCLGENEEAKDIGLVRYILFFTLVSDTFLLLVNHYAIGMTTFVVAQLLHWCRLRQKKPKYNQWILVIGILLLVGLRCLGVALDYVLVVSVFYFLCMVRNALYGLLHRENVYYSLGLFLFLCCDLNVGLFNMASYIAVPDSLTFFVEHVVAVAMWLFYLPSQVLITISVKKESPKLRKESKA